MNDGDRSVGVCRDRAASGGINAAPSTPSPIGTVVTSFPDSYSDTAITLLRDPLNSRWWRWSMAIATGCLHGAIDQRHAPWAPLIPAT